MLFQYFWIFEVEDIEIIWRYWRLLIRRQLPAREIYEFFPVASYWAMTLHLIYVIWNLLLMWKLLNKFQVSEKDFLSKAAPILCFQIFWGSTSERFRKIEKIGREPSRFADFMNCNVFLWCWANFRNLNDVFFQLKSRKDTKIQRLLLERYCTRYILFCEVIFWASLNYIMRKSLSTVTRVRWNGATLS